jgi:hypothetical protein
MFFRATLAKEFQFADNHVFWRSKCDLPDAYGVALFVSKAPGMQFVTVRQIKVSFQTRFRVNRVEMPSLVARGLSSDQIDGWKVKVGRGEDCGELLDLFRTEEYNEIDIVRDSRFAIKHGGYTAANDVTDPGVLQRMNEQRDKVRFGHEGKYGERIVRPDPQTNQGADFGRKQPCAAALSNKDFEPPANVAPGSSA